MSTARFSVQFQGESPDALRVGDLLQISGTVTVKAISGDLIDITSYGKEGTEYTLGQLAIDLVSNHLEVMT